MEEIVRFAHALGDTTRWRILTLVRNEALCVCELADVLGMPQSSVSSHLQVLRRAGLLASERREKWMYYRLERKYRGLLERIDAFFSPGGGEGAGDPVLADDQRKCRERVDERARSCCPAPVALAGRAKISKTTTPTLKP